LHAKWASGEKTENNLIRKSRGDHQAKRRKESAEETAASQQIIIRIYSDIFDTAPDGNGFL
jgi:hypothetical protein